MENVEIPQYFLCPISLQIMKDPVTTITGITYDRESIETWLRNGKRNPTCPVTKQPLTRYSDLTPNHNLRRLIQSWCTENASFGVDRIPTPKPPLRLKDIDLSEAVKTNAVIVARKIVEKSSKSILQGLKFEFFQKIVGILEDRTQSQRTTSALHVMLEACPSGRNRKLMVEAGAVFELVELELSSSEKMTTELILGVLFHLCSCAEGREHLLSHAGAIAAISGRILRVSATADDRAILIFSLICKSCSGNNTVLQEMLKVGAVSKLCMVLQSDSAPYLKEKTRDILRAHFDAWKDSPCIDVSVLTKFSK